ncbi:MAG: hypothetical protein RR320_06350 [Oscillospiraceae bacterium]
MSPCRGASFASAGTDDTAGDAVLSGGGEGGTAVLAGAEDD